MAATPTAVSGVAADPKGHRTLKVTWDAHSDSTVTAYDVRHILTSETDKSDATGDWTIIGPLRTTRGPRAAGTWNT